MLIPRSSGLLGFFTVATFFLITLTRLRHSDVSDDGEHLGEKFAYLPYPAYNTAAWKRIWKGEYVHCEGPSGQLLKEGSADIAYAHTGLMRDVVSPSIGNASVLGIDSSVCFDSPGRLGPYGYSKEMYEAGAQELPSERPQNWPRVSWRDLQNHCFFANRGRYHPRTRALRKEPPPKAIPFDAPRLPSTLNPRSHHQRFHSRTAVLIRTWTGYNYSENHLQAIRAMIVELSLLSGGEYQVFLFVNVKGYSDMWTDKNVYQRILDENVPRELHGISILWNEKLMQEWYPRVGDWQVYWHQFMPVQWFAKIHSEYEFVWNWEADARCIGNHHHVLEQIAHFAKMEPRKYMWERNTRFYIPAAHGTYDGWRNATHAVIESAAATGELNVIWGAQPYDTSLQNSIGPLPPWPLSEDEFTWGVGEEADLITLLPIWDPSRTQWAYRDKIFNFVPGVRPHFSAQDPLDINFHNPRFADIPRRTYINTISRFSRRQLHAMHVENVAGRTMAAEMWPATVALQHGLKAIYAPHPIWSERVWPGEILDAVFNADGGDVAQWSARADSVYNQDREHAFEGFTWFFNARFAAELYREWLGVAPTETGSASGRQRSDQNFVGNGSARIFHWTGRTGNKEMLCLPQMLLHPIKHV